MKKTWVLLTCVLLLALLCACGGNKEGKAIAAAWQDDYAHGAFDGAGSITTADYYIDRKPSEALPTDLSATDAKVIFYNDSCARVVNINDGYALTLSDTAEVNTDFEFSAYRSQYLTEGLTLTVTREATSFYSGSLEDYNQYLDEFILGTPFNARYGKNNNTEFTREPETTLTLLEGYDVRIGGIYVAERENLAQPYYNIAAICPVGDYTYFYLLVCKSAEDITDEFNELVASFCTFTPSGMAKNEEQAYELVLPDTWNAATRAYYEKLQAQDYVSWGFFTGALASDSDPSVIPGRTKELRESQDFLQTAFGTTFEILPSYTAMGYNRKTLDTPLTMMHEFAGGDGFNGKPVLQQTFHLDMLYGGSANSYNPLFDILNGDYDEHLRQVARDLKSYGAPILFRLCNEMDCGWVRWNGLCTLLDPDIFSMVWTHVYELFEDEGVDNCIWIFNPNAESGFNSWSQWLQYLPKDRSMVHCLGLTYYEPGNDLTVRSFASMYRELYERSTPYFEQHVWVIGEFACGAGGELVNTWNPDNPYKETERARNQVEQADWVRAMFVYMNDLTGTNSDFIANIKVAIWFNGNDRMEVDGQSYIGNYYAINEELPLTIEAFRAGFSVRKQQ